MSEVYSAVIATPLGRLGLRVSQKTVDGIDFLPASVAIVKPQGELAREMVAQLQAYFRDPIQGFDLPLADSPSVFQGRVRKAMLAIPCGQTQTYGELAGRIGSGARAVGNACRHNPLPVIVPCHRVVAAAGLGGYAGETAGEMLQRKRWLLAHEGVPLP